MTVIYVYPVGCFWHECKVINFATNINIELTFLTHTHQRTD